MLRRIKVYGQLAKFLGRRVFKAEVASAAEAVRFLLANFPHLQAHMADQHYRVTVGTYDLSTDELHDPAGQQEIKFVPVLVGAGGATGKILAGVGLIAAAIVFGPAVGGFLGMGLSVGGGAVTGAIGGVAAGLIGSIGVALALGGVSQLLTPVPQAASMGTVGKDSDQDPRKSYSFSGIQNTSRQNLPLPVIYGETIVGSITISAGVDIAAVKG